VLKLEHVVHGRYGQHRIIFSLRKDGLIQVSNTVRDRQVGIDATRVLDRSFRNVHSIDVFGDRQQDCRSIKLSESTSERQSVLDWTIQEVKFEPFSSAYVGVP
jgi:2-hydroxy-3-keto-5-methylthiopentenyl-1-phosphate phosphatase